VSAYFVLNNVISAFYADGYAHHGDLGLAVHSYREHIYEITESAFVGLLPENDILPFVKALNGSDLYLTTACADGNDDAWRRFHFLYKIPIIRFARTIQRTGITAQDLADGVFIDLFLSDRSGRSRIYSYNGKSSIATWLRVLVNHHLVSKRRVRDLVATADCISERVDVRAEQRMQSICQERKYGHMLSDSLVATCQRLSNDERRLLIWRYNDGLQLGEIGRIVGIHQANVTRRLAKLHIKIRLEVAALLSAKYRLSQVAIAECLSDLVDNSEYAFSLMDIIKNIQVKPDRPAARFAAIVRLNTVAS
jgi:RNA polymerase sigma factor (sigma-70 family)